MKKGDRVTINFNQLRNALGDTAYERLIYLMSLPTHPMPWYVISEVTNWAGKYYYVNAFNNRVLLFAENELIPYGPQEKLE